MYSRSSRFLSSTSSCLLVSIVYRLIGYSSLSTAFGSLRAFPMKCPYPPPKYGGAPIAQNNQLKPRIALWDRFCGIALRCRNYCWSEMLISSASTLLPSYSAITLSSISCTEAVLLSWRSWRQRGFQLRVLACGPVLRGKRGCAEVIARERLRF